MQTAMFLPVKTRLEREFDEFDAKHPEVYVELCRLAQKMILKGFKHYGVATIYEVMRYHRDLEHGDREFKLPNNHRAYYARKWLRDHPEHPEFFDTHETQGDRLSRVQPMLEDGE